MKQESIQEDSKFRNLLSVEMGKKLEWHVVTSDCQDPGLPRR